MDRQDIIGEIRFCICERREDIARIQRERKTSAEAKAARIGIAEKMIARLQAAVQLLERVDAD